MSTASRSRSGSPISDRSARLRSEYLLVPLVSTPSTPCEYSEYPSESPSTPNHPCVCLSARAYVCERTTAMRSTDRGLGSNVRGDGHELSWLRIRIIVLRGTNSRGEGNEQSVTGTNNRGRLTVRAIAVKGTNNRAFKCPKPSRRRSAALRPGRAAAVNGTNNRGEWYE